VPPNRIRLKDLASRLEIGCDGDADVELRGVASLEDAGPGDLTFIRSEQFVSRLIESGASAVVALPGIDVGTRPVLWSTDPSRDFSRAARILVPDDEVEPGIHASAQIADDAEIDPSASVGAQCSVGRGAVVGARSVLRPGVVLYDGVRVGEDCLLHARCVVAAASELGDRVILQPGVVVGGDGFGYVGDESGGRKKVHNIGRVVVEDDVEIGANSTVDRGTLGDTRIGHGTKIDNLVQIAHNCQIGANVIIVAQSGVAGSTRIEDDCVLLAQSGVAGHLVLGARAVVGPRAAVHKDLPANAHVLGSPHRPAKTLLREMAALQRLPELLRRVRALERLLGRKENES
jgi:UDP-3-O-[3-hydroxymyristoyl] glucosamine N-acyltransferase